MIIPCDAQTGLDVKRDRESCASDDFNVFRDQLRVSLLRRKYVPVIFVVFILINRLYCWRISGVQRGIGQPTTLASTNGGAIQSSHLLVGQRRLQYLVAEAMYTAVTEEAGLGRGIGKAASRLNDEDSINLIVSVGRLPFDLGCWWSRQLWRSA
jgi:hypothetical protein